MEHFHLTHLPDGFEVRMSASLTLVDRAVDETKRLLKSRNIKSPLFATIITIREGLTNAVRHGVADGESDIRFAIMVGSRTIRMEFEDNGPGFDWEHAFKTETPTDAEGGRGIEIIRQYSHSMVYSKGGRLLHVTIRRASL